MTHAFHATGRVYAATVCRQWKTSWPYSNSKTCGDVFSLLFSKYTFGHSWIIPVQVQTFYPWCSFVLIWSELYILKMIFNRVFCSDSPSLLVFASAPDYFNSWQCHQCNLIHATSVWVGTETNSNSHIFDFYKLILTFFAHTGLKRWWRHNRYLMFLLFLSSSSQILDPGPELLEPAYTIWKPSSVYWILTWARISFAKKTVRRLQVQQPI